MGGKRGERGKKTKRRGEDRLSSHLSPREREREIDNFLRSHGSYNSLQYPILFLSPAFNDLVVSRQTIKFSLRNTIFTLQE